MNPTFFKTQADFRQWLTHNHNKDKELLVGFYKTGTGKESITWPQSVDQALCFGWIDGVRKSIDAESYTIRFTPRKTNSMWSAINIDKMESLIALKLVKPEGLAAFEKRTENKSRIYSHEQKDVAKLPPDMEAEFKANTIAWDFFTTQAPSYQKVILHWITSAKQEKTRLQRFEKLIHASTEGKRIQ
ncbi:bacteriocin-protection protein [Flavobacterium zepuense]|uniref:Bacteriocin-protection protein n=1 Tax=Flavobacterium zepuense TaxID=2593302 RepID=A0A552VAV3_9FLAO|nr:YdeI/OmpD-associated family protein [Flavobacterium zepuense]TRW27606.1 bacteriocin-protection protein [Flavobacterium zepuense]